MIDGKVIHSWTIQIVRAETSISFKYYYNLMTSFIFSNLCIVELYRRFKICIRSVRIRIRSTHFVP